MLLHAIELSSPPASTFVAFCLCNIIIALLLLLNFGRGAIARVSHKPNVAPCNGDAANVKPMKICKFEVSNNNVIEDNDGEREENDGHKEDELMKKAEEFIQRMIRAWEAEKKMQRSQLLIC